MRSVNAWTHFLNSDYWAYSNLFFLYVGFSCLIHANGWDDFATFSVAFLALIFSYLAFKHTREKFRLDLYERRLEYSSALLNFLELVADDDYKNTLPDDCLSGIKLYNARTLFGEDVIKKLNEIKAAYKIYSGYRSAEARIEITQNPEKKS